jgi:hypothetical protein
MKTGIFPQTALLSLLSLTEKLEFQKRIGKVKNAISSR